MAAVTINIPNTRVADVREWLEETGMPEGLNNAEAVAHLKLRLIQFIRSGVVGVKVQKERERVELEAQALDPVDIT